MSIPDFVGNGVPYWLPPGLHSCSWQEAQDRFVHNRQRERVWRYLLFFLDRVKDLGGSIDRLVVDGSFVTKREEPGDVDVCGIIPRQMLASMLNGSPDADVLRVMLTEFQSAKRLFGIHVIIVDDQAALDAWVSFFAKGEPPHGLRDPDPTRDPAGVTKPAEKGLLDVDLTTYFTPARP